MIQLIRITNPLQPSVGQLRSALTYVPGMSLEYYLRSVYEGCSCEAEFDGYLDGLTVSVNGQVYQRVQFEHVFPPNGASLVLSPLTGNSGWAKGLGQLAMIAASIALVATGVGAGLGAALGFSAAAASAAGNAILAGAVGIAGNLLIAGIASLTRPAAKASSPSYGEDGPHTTAKSGGPIPKGYGTMVWGGNVIASFTEVDGQDQYTDILACFGFGPARSIRNIQINGKDINTYRNVQYYVRYGSNDQKPIPNFNRVVNGYPQQTQVLYGSPVVIPGTGTRTSILQVDVSFPSGIYFRTADGNNIEAVIIYKVEYAAAGTNNWQSVIHPRTTGDVYSYDTNGNPINPPAWVAVATDLPPSSGVVYAESNAQHYPGEPYSETKSVLHYEPDGAHSYYNRTFYGEWQPADPTIPYQAVLDWWDGWNELICDNLQTVYDRTTIYCSQPGQWDVRVTKYGSARIHEAVQPGDNWSPTIGQDLWVHLVNEIVLLEFAYPNMILIGVRALATSQLSGSSFNVTAEIEHGLRTLDHNRLPATLQAFEEDNPACVMADMALDPLYGGGQWPGFRTKNIQRFIDEWERGADLNDELVDDGSGGSIRRHRFAGVFDTVSNLWEAMLRVGAMSRACPVQMGKDIGLFVDAPDVPVQMFSVGNILQDSFTSSWLELDARANQVEVLIADKTRFYKADNPIAYMDPANQDTGVPIKNVRIDGFGITDPAQAWHLARFNERRNQFLLRSGTFSCDADAVACRQGNVVLLQHDVPQWGWGGRMLPGSTASTLLLDRSDLEFNPGTAYSVIVLRAAMVRFAGTVTAASVVTDTVGEVVGTQLSIPGYTAADRATRAILTPAGTTNLVDCKIVSTVSGEAVVEPPPGFTPAAGMAVQIFDTDVMETATVLNVTTTGRDGMNVVTLAAPLASAPDEFATYFYGPSGSQKLARVQNIRRQGDFRRKIDWIDYDERLYEDATPNFGSTRPQSTSKPGVTSLTAAERFTLTGGSYTAQVTLSWQPSMDTAGVSIFEEVIATSQAAARNPLPQLIARLPYASTYTLPANIGTTKRYIVVGYDTNDEYQAFSQAPTVTITPVGVAKNLLSGSSFASGFTFWNIAPRASDTFVPEFADDGQAVYTVAGTALTAGQVLCFQAVDPRKFAVGDTLMLSGYVADSAVSPAVNTGNLLLTLTFVDSTGAAISSVSVMAPLNGTTPSLTRYTTAAATVPVGTASVVAAVALDSAGLSLPVGSTLTLSHFLLEEATVGQTVPSAWADIDTTGQVLDIFTSGSSSALRPQGSVLPVITGNFGYTSTDDSVSPNWTGLQLRWPDGLYTFVTDGNIPITSLTAGTDYFGHLYFDVINGGVHLAPPSAPLGTPGLVSAAFDTVADAICNEDRHIPLTPGGLQMHTADPGLTGGYAPPPKNPGGKTPVLSYG